MRTFIVTLIALLGAGSIVNGSDCYLRARTVYPTYYSSPVYSYRTIGEFTYCEYYTTTTPYYWGGGWWRNFYYPRGYYSGICGHSYDPCRTRVDYRDIVLVPKAFEVAVSPDYYFSVGEYYRDRQLVDNIVARLQGQNAAYRAPAYPQGQVPVQQYQQPIQQPVPVQQPIQQQQQYQQQQLRPDQIPPNVQQQNGELPTVNGERYTPRQSQGGILKSTGPSHFQNPALLKVVQDNCAKCHSQAKQDGGLTLLTPDGKLADLTEGEIWKCFAFVNSGEMPKTAPPLKDDDVKLFYEWGKAK